MLVWKGKPDSKWNGQRGETQKRANNIYTLKINAHFLKHCYQNETNKEQKADSGYHNIRFLQMIVDVTNSNKTK